MATGAYGLRLPDVTESSLLVEDVPDHWANWRISRKVDPGQLPVAEADRYDEIGPDRARFPVLPAGTLEVDRRAAASTYRTPHPLSDAALCHPHLAATAVVTARWLGWHALHAGAFTGRRTWGLLGDKGMGKSSTLTALALAGLPVLSDDVLVLRGRTLASGPRCLDLREAAAHHFGVGEPLGNIGGRERWRLALEAPVPAESTVDGWLVLAWGERVQVDPVRPADRLRALTDNLALRLPPPDPAGLLELAGLPMLRVQRPQRLDALDEVVALLSALDWPGTPAAAS